MNSTDAISVNPNIQGGTPCFPGTCVPAVSLFDHLEQGYTLNEFLADFPSVRRERAIAVIELAKTEMSTRAEAMIR